MNEYHVEKEDEQKLLPLGSSRRPTGTLGEFGACAVGEFGALELNEDAK